MVVRPRHQFLKLVEFVGLLVVALLGVELLVPTWALAPLHTGGPTKLALFLGPGLLVLELDLEEVQVPLLDVLETVLLQSCDVVALHFLFWVFCFCLVMV